MNLTLRILCLNNSIPMYEPKGPRNAINSRRDSGILHFPRILFILSIPKKINEIIFTITRKVNGAEIEICVISFLVCLRLKLKVMH